MEITLHPTKSAYLRKESLQGLHQTSNWWLSEIEFCKIELSFLSKLIDNYLHRIRSATKLTELMATEKKVRLFRQKTIKTIYDQVVKHEQRLAALDINMFAQDEQEIRDSHEKLTRVVKGFVDSIRNLKMEIFGFAEKEMKTGKPVKK